jgi:hypothetical protein
MTKMVAAHSCSIPASAESAERVITRAGTLATNITGMIQLKNVLNTPL